MEINLKDFRISGLFAKKILHVKQNFWPNFRLYNYEMNKKGLGLWYEVKSPQ